MKTWKLTPSHKDLAWLVLIGPYDADFIEALTASIPYADRTWRGASKWLVSRDHEDALRELIDEHTAANDPSDIVGLPVLDEGGELLGSIEGVHSSPRLHVRMARTGVKSYDDLREASERVGEYRPTADVWEALELVGKPASVVVREVDGKIVVLAELEGKS